MALTTQEALARFNKAPLSQKLGGALLLIGLLSGANWYFLVNPTMEDIARKEQEHRKLEDDLIQKQSIANNLARFKHEKEVLERKLAQALTELPNEANIDTLIQSLAEIGNKSGLTITSIEPQPEQRQSFYASIPITMAVTGSYHEIGVFLDSTSKLARIVNVTNIKMSSAENGKVQADKVNLKATYVATTFRFLPQEGAK